MITVLTFEDIRPYISTENIDIKEKFHLDSMTKAMTDFVENYTNLTIDENSPKGLIQIVADMMIYYASIRPGLLEMKAEDMSLIFNNKYPQMIKKRLIEYRRLKW